MGTVAKDVFPVFVGHVAVSRNRLSLSTPQKEYVIEVPTRLAESLLHLCNGEQSLAAIFEKLGREWNRGQVKKLFAQLLKHQVFVDVRQQGAQMLERVRNPAPFPVALSSNYVDELVAEARKRQRTARRNGQRVIAETPILEILANRRSCRDFSAEQVTVDAINRLMFAAYGETALSNRTVPSAGALYPLKIHLILNRHSEPLAPGIYEVEYGPSGLLSYKCVEKQAIRAVRGFLDQPMACGAHGIAIISGNQSHQAVKYGTRALLYTVLEAGHAAQNVHLVASESNLATVEIGGFVEQSLIDTLKLVDGYQPLTTVFFGRRATSTASEDTIEVMWTVPQQAVYKPDFSVAMSRLAADVNDDWAYGRDWDPRIAAIKAKAEAREWAACSFVHECAVSAPASKLSGCLDPRTLVAFHPAQYRTKGFPFVRYDSDASRLWTEATENRTGSKAYVLSDLVYFPFNPGTEPYAYANSSGMAAHPSRNQAVETATLELVERDAFMISYFGGLSHPKVRHDSLPDGLAQRVNDLEKLGFEVSIVDISLNIAPVALVMVKHDGWHFTNVAAAARFNPEAAVSHALMEVEASVLARMDNGPAQPIVPQRVTMPHDHGALYEQRAYYGRADFLAHGRTSRKLDELGLSASKDFYQLERRVSELQSSLYTIDYTIPAEYGGNAGLHIVRVIMPGLVPMTFGYRQEPAGMRRLYEVASRLRRRSIGYRDLTKFPHPFA